MMKFDLIPSDYRQTLWIQRVFMRVGYAVVAMLVLGACLSVGLHAWDEQLQQEIAELERKQQITVQQREHLKTTNDTVKELERQLRVLNDLRGGAEAPTMFAAIDRALAGGEVWFVNWEFLRAGVAVEKIPDDRATGYFIMADLDNQQDEAWLIESRMSVVGQAKDHSALSEFVRRLFTQPEIEDIRIVNTTLASQNQYVDFELKITVNNTFKSREASS